MKTIRASEIGTFAYCQRAWWYRLQGYQSTNQAELSSGTKMHQQHGRAVLASRCMRVLAYTLILLALALLVIHVTG